MASNILGLAQSTSAFWLSFIYAHHDFPPAEIQLEAGQSGVLVHSLGLPIQHSSPWLQSNAEDLSELRGQAELETQIPPFPSQLDKPPSSFPVLPVKIKRTTITTTKAITAPIITHQILASPFFIIRSHDKLSSNYIPQPHN